ncbi:hypothetical protein SDC9_82425 [bioreactor metagenome]|uniref:Uncharacterized protein n=1 Tax=bioreactor metagenome TaxID=1076179 RepID=A0A644Z744_9ZZZZ
MFFEYHNGERLGHEAHENICRDMGTRHLAHGEDTPIGFPCGVGVQTGHYRMPGSGRFLRGHGFRAAHFRYHDDIRRKTQGFAQQVVHIHVGAFHVAGPGAGMDHAILRVPLIVYAEQVQLPRFLYGIDALSFVGSPQQIGNIGGLAAPGFTCQPDGYAEVYAEREKIQHFRRRRAPIHKLLFRHARHALASNREHRAAAPVGDGRDDG